MRGCFFVNCDTIDAKWATLEAFLVIFKAFCLSVCTKPDNFDLDIYYDGKKPPLKEKSNQICKFYHQITSCTRISATIFFFKFEEKKSPTYANLERHPPFLPLLQMKLRMTHPIFI